MKLRQTILTLICLTMPLFAYHFNGFVMDNQTKKPLSGANVEILNSQQLTFTNQTGYFAFETLPEKIIHIRISHIGYATIEKKLNINRHTNQRFFLTPSLIKFDPVQVTITKSKKKLSNATLPIVSYDNGQFSQTGPENIAKAISKMPGIALTSDGTWSQSISIRGLTKNNIAILVDGNRISTATNLSASLSLIDIHDVDRIETIKSGASTLYGSGATGGVINIITKKANYSDQFYLNPKISAGFSSVNQLNYQNFSLFSGQNWWNFKLSLQNRNAEDAETPRGTLENSQFKDFSISSRLNIRPSKNHEMSLNFQQFLASDVGIPGGFPIFPPGAEVRYVNADRELYSFSYKINNLSYRISALSFKIFQQNIHRKVENIPHITKINNNKEVTVEKVVPRADHQTTGFQLFSNWILNESNFLTAGIDGWQKRLNSHRTKYLHIDIYGPDENIAKKIDREIEELPLPKSNYGTAGLFLTHDIMLLEQQLIVTAGARYDLTRIKSEKVLNPLYHVVNGNRIDSPDGQAVLWNAEEDTDRSYSLNIGFKYNWNKRFSLSSNFSKSFRSPSLEERFQYIDQGTSYEIGDPTLNAEINYTKDIALKYNPKRGTIKLSFFHNSMTNLVTEEAGVYNDKPTLFKVNAGRAVLYGGEVSGKLQLPYNFALSTAISFVYGEETKENTPLPYIPPLNGKLFLDYILNGNWFFSVSINGFHEQKRTAVWERETAGYMVYNFYCHTKKFSIMNHSVSLLFKLENLTNKAYRNHLSSNRGLMRAEPGRNYSVNISFEM